MEITIINVNDILAFPETAHAAPHTVNLLIGPTPIPMEWIICQ
jgi:hypothetical protein